MIPKLIYEIHQNGTISSGDVQNLLQVVEYGCPIRLMMKQNNQANLYNCDQVSTYANTTNPESSVVGCGFFQNMATNSDSLPKMFSFQENMYHYYVWYNSNGVAAESRWLFGEHTPVGDQTFPTYHTKWFTDADCYVAAVGEVAE